MSEQKNIYIDEVPSRLIEYNYECPSFPFTAEQISYIESIRSFLSNGELAQARRLEVFRYNTFFGRPNELGIPGLRASEKTYSLYLKRFDDQPYGEMMDGFLDAIFMKTPQESLGGVIMPGYRVTMPSGERYYAFEFNGELQAWVDHMIGTAVQFGTLMAWFDQGKFSLTDGRRFPFADLHIEQLEGGKPVPVGW